MSRVLYAKIQTIDENASLSFSPRVMLTLLKIAETYRFPDSLPTITTVNMHTTTYSNSLDPDERPTSPVSHLDPTLLSL